MKYEKIRTKFKKYGDTHMQVYRDGDWAIYECVSPTNRVRYEVVIIKRRDACNVYGRLYPPMEVYPASEQWGAYGWTILGTEDDAVAFLKKKREAKKLTSRAKVTLNRRRTRPA